MPAIDGTFYHAFTIHPGEGEATDMPDFFAIWWQPDMHRAAVDQLPIGRPAKVTA